MSEKLIGLTEFAKALGVSIHLIRRLVGSGEIRSVNVGARRLIPLAELERVAVHGCGKSRKQVNREKESYRS